MTTTSVSPDRQHDSERMRATCDLASALYAAMNDTPRALPPLDALALLYAADDAERAALAAFAARVAAQRASYLTVADLARAWKVSPAVVRRWAADGLLSGQRGRGGKWLFTPAAVERFLTARTRPRVEVQ